MPSEPCSPQLCQNFCRRLKKRLEAEQQAADEEGPHRRRRRRAAADNAGTDNELPEGALPGIPIVESERKRKKEKKEKKKGKKRKRRRWEVK
jgi:hypothetical protein